MRLSEKTTDLIAALLKVQNEIKNPLRNSPNDYFKSRYANLEQVLAVTIPVLNANGFVLSQTHEWRDSVTFIQTTLFHISGQFIQSEMPLLLNKGDMQNLGSATTYARRYSIVSMLGIEQEDDDGNSIQKKDPVKTQAISVTSHAPSKTVNEAIGKLKEEILKPGHIHEWRDDKYTAGQQYCACPLHNGERCKEKRRNPSV